MSASPSVAPSQDRAGWASLLQLAAREVFELMLGCQLTIPAQPLTAHGLEITSMVGLAGKLCGIVSFRCSSNSAARMASSMLGVDADKSGPEMWDAVGEICNMIAGNFKNKVPGLGDGCMLSVPTVITGADYRMHSMVDAGIFSTVLLYQGEPVTVTLEVQG